MVFSAFSFTLLFTNPTYARQIYICSLDYIQWSPDSQRQVHPTREKVRMTSMSTGLVWGDKLFARVPKADLRGGNAKAYMAEDRTMIHLMKWDKDPSVLIFTMSIDDPNMAVYGTCSPR